MAHAGHPLWGDNRYGSGKPGQQIALWGYRLKVEHPTLHTLLQFQHLPQGGIWSSFTPTLNQLSSEKT